MRPQFRPKLLPRLRSRGVLPVAAALRRRRSSPVTGNRVAVPIQGVMTPGASRMTVAAMTGGVEVVGRTIRPTTLPVRDQAMTAGDRVTTTAAVVPVRATAVIPDRVEATTIVRRLRVDPPAEMTMTIAPAVRTTPGQAPAAATVLRQAAGTTTPRAAAAPPVRVVPPVPPVRAAAAPRADLPGLADLLAPPAPPVRVPPALRVAVTAARAGIVPTAPKTDYKLLRDLSLRFGSSMHRNQSPDPRASGSKRSPDRRQMKRGC
jgi:hypothetical protein